MTQPVIPAKPRSMLEAVQRTPTPTDIASFIKAGDPKPQIVSPLLERNVKSAPAEKKDSLSSPSPELPKIQPEKGVAMPASGLTTLTVRLPSELVASLLKASLDRKMKNREPFTQQGIVAEVLQQWLQKHGYIPGRG